MTFKRSPRPKIWLYPQMPKPSVEGEYDIVLSPQLYLVHRVDFPIRFAYQAQKIAPSVMEELGAGNDWIYEAYRDEGGWIFLAYDPVQLLKLLEQVSLNPHRVRRLFFAQQYAEKLSRPVALGEKNVVTNVQGTVTILPAEFVDNEILTQETLNTFPEVPKSFAFRASEGTAIPWKTRELILLSLSVLLFAGAWISEGLRAGSEKKRLETELRESAHGDPTLISSITRRSIHDRYAAIDRRQRAVRRILKRIGSLVSKESKLSSVQITPEGYRAVLEVRSDKIPELKRLANSYKLHPSVRGNQVIVKGEWQ